MSMRLPRPRLTWPPRLAALIVAGLLVGPFVVAAWLALVRVAFRLFWIEVFP